MVAKNMHEDNVIVRKGQQIFIIVVASTVTINNPVHVEQFWSTP